MANRSRKGKSFEDPRNTRVYAPTHRSGIKPNEQKQDKPVSRQAGRPAQTKTGLRAIQQATGQTMDARANKPSKKAACAQRKPATLQTYGRQETERKPTGRYTGASNTVIRKSKPQDKQAKPGKAQRAEAGKQKQPASTRHKSIKSRTKQGNHYEGVHRLESPLQWEKQKQKKARKQREPIDQKKLLTILISIVSMFILLAAGYFIFLVDTIFVEGNEKYSESSIVSVTGLTTGRHMLFYDLEKIKADIAENPYLKVVGVERELPRTIHITIVEREEAAAIAVQDYHVIIDVEGHVLSISTGSDISNLLRITGISQMGFQVNQPLDTGSNMQIQALMLILQQIEAFNLRADIVSIDLTNPLRLSMQTKEGIAVLLGQSDNMEKKMYWLRETLPSLRGGGITEGTLDVSAKSGAIYSPPQATPPASSAPEKGEPGEGESGEQPIGGEGNEPEGAGE